MCRSLPGSDPSPKSAFSHRGAEAGPGMPCPIADLAVLLARGYLRLLARKAPSGAGNPAPEARGAGLDSSGGESDESSRQMGGIR